MADPMMGMMGGGDMGEEPSQAEHSQDMNDEEAQAAIEAFPELAEDPARIEALKTFVRLCVEKHMGGEYDEEEPKPKADLLLAFGKPGKPKK
jgi:membrane protease subunit (stomatin/prohibitin family)